MKKYLFILPLFLLFFSKTFAIDYSCFQNYWTISWVTNKTIKVVTDDINNYYFQDDKLLNTKILSSYERKYFSFEVDWNLTTNYTKTFDQYENLKQISIKFSNTLLKNTFSYSLSTDNYNYYFEISKDWIAWNKIEDDITNYDLDFLRITFDNKNLKNTTIYDLSFFQNWNNQVLVNSLSNSNINAYNNYICDNDELSKLIRKTKATEYFPIDTNTKTFNLYLKENPKFDGNHIIQYVNKDTDNDWVINTLDNCINDYNPNQLDSDAIWIWDVCSDKDWDWVNWNTDNCTTIYNPDQKDENKNGVWDDCEVDTDKDNVFDSIDNCVNISNELQYDIDWDRVWDDCDNCLEKYNSDQKDIDKDNIWDDCDNKDDRYIESNKTFFVWILIAFVLVFLLWIYVMVKKLKSIQK